jgi:dihydroflavonol-4-reductase
MKVFITGGTGFIGKYVVRRLIEAGHQVRCLVRNDNRLNGLSAFDFERVPGDVSSLPALRTGMAGCDWVIHLAGQYAMWSLDPGSFTRVNVEGTRNVMQAALDCGASKVIHMSTVAVYGKPTDCPFTEDSRPGLELFSRYGQSKADGERIAWNDFRERGLPLVVLYPGIVLGAGDDRASGQYLRLILFRRTPSTIFHDSRSIYVHVRDVADAVLRAALMPGNLGEKYLIGKEAFTGRQLADLVHDVSGVPLPPLRLPDPIVQAASHLFTGVSTITRRPPLWTLSIDASRTLKNGFIFDGSKAVRDLGLRYTPVKKAMEEAVAWYRMQELSRTSC